MDNENTEQKQTKKKPLTKLEIRKANFAIQKPKLIGMTLALAFVIIVFKFALAKF